MADESVSVRSVKLKVHYTFDVEHKNDHLTKPPQSFEVQTAAIDDNTTIGIVELRTCLEAVVAASPELTSVDENDFTVYAYDYSEPNTPLVGQGRLSKIFSQDMDSDADSETMVTGRITKSVLGMFSKNAQPFLEVKLRFTPVATSGARGRSGSMSSMDGVQSQWSGLLQAPQSPADTSGLEAMQRMLSEGGPSRDRRGSYQVDSFHQGGVSRPSSRPGTPNQAHQFTLPPQQMNFHPRPSSQAGFRQPSHARRDSFNSGYYSAEENLEEGPARKRARTTKVKQPTKSDFNIEQQPNSLRVAASTASSVRLHRPVPLNPTAALQQGLSAEEPVRPPTPIPKQGNNLGRGRGRPKKRIYPNLEKGRGRAASPANQLSLDSAMSSPEDSRDHPLQESTNSTPDNLPSSPPVMHEQQSFVTSPTLPALHHRDDDSGFMSGTLDDLFGNGDEIDFSEFLADKADLHGRQNLELQHHSIIDPQYPPVFEDDSAVEGPTPQPILQTFPTPTLLPAPQKPMPRSLSQGPSKPFNGPNVPKTVRSAPPLLPRPQQTTEVHRIPEMHRAHSMLPQIPASDPVGRHFHRSNTWTPDMSDAIMSDAAGPNDPNKPRSRKRVGKEQTQARLENAIAAGQMPPFCDNCGAIETPAWRRGFIKIFECPWDEVETSLLPGACCYKEPLDYHPDGTIKRFKGYKVEKLPTDKFEDWKQINLCNPCGLWFHKSKCPRPPEKWQKKDPKEKKKRKRPSKGKSRINPPRAAAGNLQTDDQTPASDESSPADIADTEDNADNMTADENGDDGEPQLPPMPARPASAQPAFRSYHAFTSSGPVPRLVQSSPLGRGSMGLTNESDNTPKPLRRVLFPSPPGKAIVSQVKVPLSEKINEALLPSFIRRSPRLNKIRNVFAESGTAAAITIDGEGKENVTPVAPFDDGLGDLFGNDDDGLMLPPLTPTPKRRSERILSKTPQRSPGREFGIELSPSLQNVLSSRIKTPKIAHPLASVMLESAQRNLDPKMMTPFTRSIHEALAEGAFQPQSPKVNSKSSRTPKKNVAGSHAFDFPDLPSLKNSSPMSAEAMAFNFSELTTDRIQTDFDDIFSTEAAMPSSPPTGFFEFLNSNNDKSSLWDHIDFSGAGDETQQQFQTPKKQKTAEEKLLKVATPNGLRRSPRKNHSQA